MQQIPPCIPERVRSWIAARRPRRVVEAAGPRAQVMRDVGGKRDPLRSLELRLPEQRLSSDSADRQRHPWVETVLELPSDAVLRRQLALPRQVRDQLHSVLGYEIDRLTPFARSEVYFDARVLDDPPGAAKLRVELAVCRRDQARDWLDTLRQAGAPADRLAWAGAWPGANLLPAGERPQRRNWGLLINAALGLLAVLLVVLLLISPLWQRQQTHQALEDQLRELRARAAEVAQVREELEQARVGSVAVLQRKADAPRMTDLLRELTDLLPDGTWVQTLNYREGEVDIRGESTQATALIALLENGPGISNVTFRSPVMQIASSGTERFHIAFTYQRPDS
jgi:general secretion pathway protein L